MKRRKREIDPTEYLRNVLNTWEKFCEEHPCFAKAIQQVLEENEQLKKNRGDYNDIGKI